MSDLEVKDGSKTAPELLSAKKEKTTSQEDAQNKVVDSAYKIEGRNFETEASIGGRSEKQIGTRDLEIDIVECTNSGGHGLFNDESEGATENSSSFGDTMSGTENGSMLSDAEVESPLCGGTSLGLLFDRFDGHLPVRKKKLTDHWRRFIHPVMWRCKWIELQLKEFKSQELKYERELIMHRQRKLIEYESFTLEGVDSKSIPFSCQTRKNKVMRRMKRKRVEETADVVSFASQHKLFSYFASKKSNPPGATMVDDFGNLDNRSTNGNDDIELPIEFSDDPLEHILQKIEGVQMQVQSLKSQVDMLVSESPRKFSSINRLSLLGPFDTLAGNGSIPSPENGDTVPPFRSLQSSSHLIPGCHVGDLLMPRSAVPGQEEVTPLSDMIRSLDQYQIGGTCESTEEEILIYNQAARAELHNFEGALCQQTEKAQIAYQKEKAVVQVQPLEGDLPTDASKISVQPNLNLLSTSKSKSPNKKKKEGRQIFGSAKRGKKSQG